MRDQLEERVEALEAMVLDLIDVVTKVTISTVNVPNTDSLTQTLRNVGSTLASLYPSTTVQPVGSNFAEVGDVVQRLKATGERMLDRKAGIT